MAEILHPTESGEPEYYRRDFDRHAMPGVRLTARLANALRSVVFPGLDLHTRSRRPCAAIGNKAIAMCWMPAAGTDIFRGWPIARGRVVAMNILPDQVARSQSLLVDYRGADPQRLQFEVRNLYDLAGELRRFDEIICYETLEHLRNDRDVCRHFFRLLKPGGVLHLCCPYRLHPRHQAEVLDEAEQGGHVRAGYTHDDYRALLEPLGFQIEMFVGLGGPALYHADRVLRAIRSRFGDVAALPLFPLLLPLACWPGLNRPIPFSLYCRCPQGDRGTTGRHELIHVRHCRHSHV